MPDAPPGTAGRRLASALRASQGLENLSAGLTKLTQGGVAGRRDTGRGREQSPPKADIRPDRRQVHRHGRKNGRRSARQGRRRGACRGQRRQVRAPVRVLRPENCPSCTNTRVRACGVEAGQGVVAVRIRQGRHARPYDPVQEGQRHGHGHSARRCRALQLREDAHPGRRQHWPGNDKGERVAARKARRTARLLVAPHGYSRKNGQGWRVKA